MSNRNEELNGLQNSKLRPIFYDTETTGIKPDRDRIVEIAAFDPFRNCSFEKLINPGISIPKEASDVHNITDDMVANAPSFKEVATEFAEFCSGNVCLIAHNNDAFDVHFLRQEYLRAEIEFPTWKFFDTLKWARRYRKDLPRHTLQFLRETYQIPENNAHRALDDVIVLHRVFECMTDDLSFEEVYALMNIPRELQHMPFGKHQGVPIKQLPKSYVRWLMESGALEKPENQELKRAIEKVCDPVS